MEVTDITKKYEKERYNYETARSLAEEIFVDDYRIIEFQHGISVDRFIKRSPFSAVFLNVEKKEIYVRDKNLLDKAKELGEKYEKITEEALVLKTDYSRQPRWFELPEPEK